jgi:hypothetical protein
MGCMKPLHVGYSCEVSVAGVVSVPARGVWSFRGVRPAVAYKVSVMLMPDSSVFDHLRRTMYELRQAAPDLATRVRLEAAMRSLSSSPMDVPKRDGTRNPSETTTGETLRQLMILVKQSQIRFGEPHRHRLTSCAMWLHTAERYWDQADNQAAAHR